MASEAAARQNGLVGLSVALTTVSVIIVGLRTYTRAIIVRNLGKDDYCMLAALVFCLGYLACIVLLRLNGVGYDGDVVPPEAIMTAIKTVVGITCLYYLIGACVKISILFFYLRIAVERQYARVVKGTIIFVALMIFSFLVCTFTQCVPLRKLWDLENTVEGFCFSNTGFFYASSVLNVSTDFWILILPMKMLLAIKRPMREKLALIAIFAIGGFSCVAAILRTYYAAAAITGSSNFFESAVPINTWSMVEVHAGVWCASIPALKALISRKEFERKMAQRSTGYPYRGGSGAVRITPLNDETELEMGSRERIVSKVEHEDLGMGPRVAVTRASS